MEKIIWVLLLLVFIAGCQEERHMAPDDVDPAEHIAKNEVASDEK